MIVVNIMEKDIEKLILNIVDDKELSIDMKFELIEDVVMRFFKWRGKPNSSNVKKMMYNNETRELVVLFNSGEYYTYYDITFDRFQRVLQGAGVCRTEGKNKWGEWFVGKTPSVGAALYKELVLSGARYEKGGSLR
jgi:hypothetical protein